MLLFQFGQGIAGMLQHHQQSIYIAILKEFMQFLGKTRCTFIVDHEIQFNNRNFRNTETVLALDLFWKRQNHQSEAKIHTEAEAASWPDLWDLLDKCKV